MDAQLINAIKQAEEILAQKERKEQGDLEGLPPGHPLLRALKESEERYAEKEFEKAQTEDQAEQHQVRKVKKLKKKSVLKERIKEEDEAQGRWKVAKAINSRIDNVLKAVETLMKANEEFSETVNSIPHMKVRMSRVMRLSAALHRGLSDSRLNQTVAGRVS